MENDDNARAEIAALKAENARLRDENNRLRAGLFGAPSLEVVRTNERGVSATRAVPRITPPPSSSHMS
jgi:hypothetical protein